MWSTRHKELTDEQRLHFLRQLLKGNAGRCTDPSLDHVHINGTSDWVGCRLLDCDLNSAHI
jgi:hypothetical protein